LHYIHELHQQYGPIVRISPNEVAIADTQAFKSIHGGFPKSSWYIGQTTVPIKAVFNMSDNKEHATRRRLLAKGFTKSNIVRDWEDTVFENVKLCVRKMIQDAKQSPTGNVDVMKWWIFLAADISAKFLFGESFNMLEAGEVSIPFISRQSALSNSLQRNAYMINVERNLMLGGIGYELPIVRTIGSYVPIQAVRDVFGSSQLLREYGEKAVAASKNSTQTKTNVFKTMFAEADKDESALTDEDVAVEAGNLLVAGTDTTAITLTYLVWAVAQRPELQDALVTELINLAENELNDARLAKLPLLNAVINETLRLYGAAPASLCRTVPSGGTELCNFPLPEGLTVSTQSYTMHRWKHVWGPDADEFVPARWLPNSKTPLSDEARAAFTPFGGASRYCLGIHLAWMEMRLATAVFYRECEGIRVAEQMTEKDMEFENYFLIKPQSHHCLLRLQGRSVSKS
jgi:cytochrome P450